MQSTPVSIARPKALEQFPHRFGIAHRGLQDPRRQVLQAGQGQRLLFHFAQRLAVEFDLEIDVAQAVVAVDLGGAAGDGEAGHGADHHRAGLARHRQAFEQAEVLARRGRQLDDDGHLRWARFSLAMLWS
jgi:hypothetical protein